MSSISLNMSNTSKSVDQTQIHSRITESNNPRIRIQQRTLFFLASTGRMSQTSMLGVTGTTWYRSAMYTCTHTKRGGVGSNKKIPTNDQSSRIVLVQAKRGSSMDKMWTKRTSHSPKKSESERKAISQWRGQTLMKNLPSLACAFSISTVTELRL